MNVAPRQSMSLEAFLFWEEHQELRHEFDGVRPVAMTGGTLAHATIQANLANLGRQSLALNAMPFPVQRYQGRDSDIEPLS